MTSIAEMVEAKEVKLGGATFAIPSPLMLGQLIDLNVAVRLPTSSDPQEETRRGFMRSCQIVLAGIKNASPDMTIEQMMMMQITGDELRDASSAVLQLSGLIPQQGTSKPGEAEAEAE
jgi:hypothetical protein